MTPSSVLPSTSRPGVRGRRAPASVAACLSLTLALAAMGCGGTNSETPWPVEPEDVDLGPEGETRTNDSLGAPAAPGGAKTAPKSKPKAAPATEPAEEPKQRAPEPSTPSNPSTQF